MFYDSGVRTGTAHVFYVGSTGALGAIEYEPGLLEDLPDLLDKLIPPGGNYGHERAWHDGNGHSHLQATLLGPSLTVPVADRKPVLGTWQQIFHLECDIKPRHRTIAGEPCPVSDGLRMPDCKQARFPSELAERPGFPTVLARKKRLDTQCHSVLIVLVQ